MTTSSDSAQNVQYPAWQREYQTAIAEANPLYLGEKIHAAETAISKRLQALKDAPENSAERQAIAAATDALHKLQIKVFGHPDWQT